MSVLAGLVVLVLGIALRIWANLWLATAKPDGEDDLWWLRLRTPKFYTARGPYAWLRHPAYWGSGLMCMGIGMIALGWGGFVLFVPLWPHLAARAIEEDAIRERSDTLG